MLNLSIGERIAELRKERDISQGQLAQLLDVTRQAVSKWENDQSSPDTIKLIRLADILDTDIEYLATGRRSYGRRPPMVLRSTEVVERVVEKPVVQVVEKVVETTVERPVVQYVEKTVVEYVDKPVVKTVTRTRYLRNPVEYAIVALVGLLLGFLAGWLV